MYSFCQKLIFFIFSVSVGIDRYLERYFYGLMHISQNAQVHHLPYSDSVGEGQNMGVWSWTKSTSPLVTLHIWRSYITKT